MRSRTRAPHPKGASLLEVLIASLVLMVSLIALGTQAGVGIRAAQRVELESQATLLCQSILEEQLVGSGDLEFDRTRPISAYPGWNYQLTLSTPDSPGPTRSVSGAVNLKLLSVSVWKSGKLAEISRTTLERLVSGDLCSHRFTGSALEIE
ncbi:type IV pilus modification PilV family protein [Planctomycetaceae bacterium SH139]